jgi:hypothetical protein
VEVGLVGKEVPFAGCEPICLAESTLEYARWPSILSSLRNSISNLKHSADGILADRLESVIHAI